MLSSEILVKGIPLKHPYSSCQVRGVTPQKNLPLMTVTWLIFISLYHAVKEILLVGYEIH